MAERMELPTKAQIAALTDPSAIKALIEDIEGVVTTIETRLEYSGINDDDWRARAQGALIRHKTALRQLNRRAHDLRFVALRHPSRLHGQKAKATSKPANNRPDSENDPLTNEALDEDHTIDLSAFTEVAQADARLADLDRRIAAVARDRDDEIATPAQKRDEGFLAATKSALAAMRNSRSTLQTHRNRLMRGTVGETYADKVERQNRRERRFVDAARDLLPAASFQAIWDRVERQEVEAGGTGAMHESVAQSPRQVSRQEIDAAMTPGGAWTKATLASWGVPWPPPAGWKAALEAGTEIPAHG